MVSRDVAINLGQPNIKKSQCTNTLHNERNKVFRTDVYSRMQKEKEYQIIKLKASGNVYFVCMMSFTF